MSREQQIEEMEKIIGSREEVAVWSPFKTDEQLAEELYTAGYRKADELIAENEQLRERNASYDRQIRADARREFAEKLKNYYNNNFKSLRGSINCSGVAYYIDQILADFERKEEQ